MSAELPLDLFPMRAPCPACRCTDGVIRQRGGQDVCFCAQCDRWCYNVPRVETGRAVRSVTTIHSALRPKQRSRILARDGGRCVLCGATAQDGLQHIDHIVPVVVGLEQGLTELTLNSDENLLTLCAECNLGKGRDCIPLWLVVALLRRRQTA